MDAQTLGVGVVFGGLVVGGVWRWWTWRQEHGTLVTVQIDIGVVKAGPAVAGAITLTVYNGSAHPVRVSGVALQHNRGPRGTFVQVVPQIGATIPGVISPHDSGMTWFETDYLEAQGLDLTRPAWGRISLAEQSAFIYSKRKRLLKKS